MAYPVASIYIGTIKNINMSIAAVDVHIVKNKMLIYNVQSLS